MCGDHGAGSAGLDEHQEFLSQGMFDFLVKLSCQTGVGSEQLQPSWYGQSMVGGVARVHTTFSPVCVVIMMQVALVWANIQNFSVNVCLTLQSISAVRHR